MIPQLTFLLVPALIFALILLAFWRDAVRKKNTFSAKVTELERATRKAKKELAKSLQQQEKMEEKMAGMVTQQKHEQLTHDLQETSRKKNFRLKELRLQIDVMHQQQMELERALEKSVSAEEHDQALHTLSKRVEELEATNAGLASQLEKAYFRLSQADAKLVQQSGNQNES